jgi:hypothetical protein
MLSSYLIIFFLYVYVDALRPKVDRSCMSRSPRARRS